MKNINLDDAKTYEKYDSEKTIDRILEMPSVCEKAWQQALDFSLPDNYKNINKVFILGMGGSAIGGDLSASLVVGESTAPVSVIREYELPPSVDDKTLVIASSYSGETEETLTAFKQALKTPAKKLVMTTGGTLQRLAEENKLPAFIIKYKTQPRAALPLSFLPVLCFLQKLNIIKDRSIEVKDMISNLNKQVKQMSPDIPTENNSAKYLAKKLFGRIPVIYGAGITSQVARRWKTQINENSKAWAFFEIFPELNHNALVGYQWPVELQNKIMVIMLSSSLLNPRLKLRYRITGEILRQSNIDYETIEAAGTYPLSHLMDLILYGDLVSYYLAMLYGTDPTPVNVISYLKKELASR